MQKLFSLLLLLTAYASLSLQAQEANIGVIDMEQVLQKATAVQQLHADLDKVRMEKQQKLDELQASYREKEKAMHTEGSSEEVKRKTLFELQKIQSDIHRHEQKIESGLEQQKTKKMKELMEGVRPIVQRLADQKGIKLVLTKDAASSIFYYHSSIDLTDELIGEWNKAAQ